MTPKRPPRLAQPSPRLPLPSCWWVWRWWRRPTAAVGPPVTTVGTLPTLQRPEPTAVVGLGTQDSLGEARELVARYGTTFTVLWDESFRSWRQLGFPGQPAAVLLAPDGTEIEVVRPASRR